MAKEGAGKGKAGEKKCDVCRGYLPFCALNGGRAGGEWEGGEVEGSEGRKGGRSEGEVAPVGEEEGRGDDVRAWEGRVWTTRAFAVYSLSASSRKSLISAA